MFTEAYLRGFGKAPGVPAPTYIGRNTKMAKESKLNRSQLKVGAVFNEHVSTTAAIAEAKVAFDPSAGHNHDGMNSALIKGAGGGSISQKDVVEIDRRIFTSLILA